MVLDTWLELEHCSQKCAPTGLPLKKNNVGIMLIIN
jgi:hypothetical protein